MAGLPYQSDVPVSLTLLNGVAAAIALSAANDYLQPFIPRADVTIDAVWWWRLNATAANVFVGIYDATGTLLTDCAVDAGTTTGLHSVSTTPVLLTGGNIYYFALNESAQVAVADSIDRADAGEFSYTVSTIFPAIDPRMTTSAVGSGVIGSFNKARATAALPSTQTMTGWTLSAARALGGFVPQ